MDDAGHIPRSRLRLYRVGSDGLTSCVMYAACAQIYGSKSSSYLCALSDSTVQSNAYPSHSVSSWSQLAASYVVTIGMHHESHNSAALNV